VNLDILNVGYRSVNCYLLITNKAELLVDVGWPNGMSELKKSMALQGMSVKDVTHVLMTHYHIDHAGIAQELKDKGARLIIMENQKDHLNDLKKYLRPPMVFHEIKNDGNIELRFIESRDFLREMEIFGEIVPTPGHGPDHVTLVLDEGIAFIGDLPPEYAAEEGSAAFDDWKRLRSMNVKRIFPAHGNFDIALKMYG
jgi:endoribonuclease LACTB2